MECYPGYHKRNQSFLYRFWESEDQFLGEYHKLYSNETNAAQLFTSLLIEIEKLITVGEVEALKKYFWLFKLICNSTDRKLLNAFFGHVENPFRCTNLVILACKFNQVEILNYLFETNTEILTEFAKCNRKAAILPNEVDGQGRTAFYYSIRSGNVTLVEKLIHKWPQNHFVSYSRELDELISQAYENLKIRNVPLETAMEIFIENKIVNLRFFSNKKVRDVKNFSDHIVERIDLVLDNISLLQKEYLNGRNVDENFLFVSKFIVRNIHLLKRQLKSSLLRVPWEEIEFCLITFIISHTKKQELNLFYHITLNKLKILKYLQHFALKLENEKLKIETVDITKITDLSNFKREEVVAQIIKLNPEFAELYQDYEELRDVYSLTKIVEYLKLALDSASHDYEGQMILTRTLQIIGENLKNTLESPKMSKKISERLLALLPTNTRKLITDLRNSYSHARALSKRREIEKNMDPNFFVAVQNDMKKIGGVINSILVENKMKTIRTILKSIRDCESFEEMKEIVRIFQNASIGEWKIENFFTTEHQRIRRLVEKLSDEIPVKTEDEKKKIERINDILNETNEFSKKIELIYIKGYAVLQSLSLCLSSMGKTAVAGIKFRSEKILQELCPIVEKGNLKEIGELAWSIQQTAGLRVGCEEMVKIYTTAREILFSTAFGDDIRSIEDLKLKLLEDISKKKLKNKPSRDEYGTLLSAKISEFKNILTKYNVCSDDLFNDFKSFKSNTRLQVLTEMLILDIMSILSDSRNSLINNSLFLDDNMPLLTGKCLRNHLAHDNIAVEILLSDPLNAVLMNARLFATENILKNKRKLGKIVKDDPSILKTRHGRSAKAITHQRKLFEALEQSHFEDIQKYLDEGADIFGRDINLCTTLHYAVRGTSVDIVKFVLAQNVSVYVKNVYGQIALHVAAACGRHDIVKFLLEQKKIDVNVKDGYAKTPLHHATENGHPETVEILLKHKANVFAEDMDKLVPLYLAMKNNRIDVVKILLRNVNNVDVFKVRNQHSPLHEPSESGNFEIAKLLIQKNANVNAKDERNWTPLHATSFHGHFDIAELLLENGANVNATVINGLTALHYAVEGGHNQIVGLLLKHGAQVNAFDKINNKTPLHYAARYGNYDIAKKLLAHKANANALMAGNVTTLHVAATFGHAEIASLLLKKDVDVNAVDKTKCTPLFMAAREGHTNVVELLINKNARTNVNCFVNQTPLHVAASGGYANVVKLLLKNGADVTAQDYEGNTPLFAAAISKSTETMNLLIKYIPDVNVRNFTKMTALHVAALHGSIDAVETLVKNNADVAARCDQETTPLFGAVLGNNIEIVSFLIKHGAIANVEDKEGCSPLHFAVMRNQKDIVNLLIEQGADVNKSKGEYNGPLTLAIKNNNLEIVELLLANGANVHSDDENFKYAAVAGYKSIIDILLKYSDKNESYNKALEIAVLRGHKEITKELLSRSANFYPPFFIAAEQGHDELLQMLIDAGVNVNTISKEGNGALHLASAKGHVKVVEVLIENGIDASIKDWDKRTALELAVSYGHVEIVNLLLEYQKVNINSKGNAGWTLLHIASQGSCIEMVKFLVEKGADIHALKEMGAKPIHTAAREGFLEAVKYFVELGMSLNEPNNCLFTPLSYAVQNNQEEVVKFLIEKGANVKAADNNEMQAVHIAAYLGHKNMLHLLVKSGAFYNATDRLNRKPINFAKDVNIKKIFEYTDDLFKATKENNLSKVENSIKFGAYVNAKASDNLTALHHAAGLGYEKIVSYLLKNGADPNTVGEGGWTPLHYAAKFSHYEIVKVLLHNGAIYNVKCYRGKTPGHFAKEATVSRLLNQIDEAFKKIKFNSAQVIKDLKKMNFDEIKMIMRCCNEENKTLIVVAMQNNFSKLKELEEISQENVSQMIEKSLRHCSEGNYQKSLDIASDILEKRRNLFGSDNPATLEIQNHIGTILFNKGDYQECLKIHEEVLEKQKKLLGPDHPETLKTNNFIAIVLHNLDRNENALKIYREICKKQIDILGPNHSDTLESQLHMALVLNSLREFEESLSINTDVFEKSKKMFGINNPFTIRAHNNMALVLTNQGKFAEALKIYEDVYARKVKVFGGKHRDTLLTLSNTAEILAIEGRHEEAINTFQKIYKERLESFGPNHPETLHTQYCVANTHFQQHTYLNAARIYQNILTPMTSIYGPSHKFVLDITNKLEEIKWRNTFEGKSFSDIPKYFEKDTDLVVRSGDLQKVKRLLELGVNPNDADSEGRTALHFAVGYRHLEIVKFLLKNGADIGKTTNKGNTALHIALANGFKELLSVLLENLKPAESRQIINSKTVLKCNTCLHIAVQKKRIDIVKLLLQNGAVYNMKNLERKTPLDLATDKIMFRFLILVDDLFKDVTVGNKNVLKKLESLKSGDFSAIANARNVQGNTLLQVALSNQHYKIAGGLLLMLQNPDQLLEILPTLI